MITVRKIQQAQATQINTPEDEEIVRGWLSAMGITDYAGIADLKARGFWFLRDHGSEIVYVASSEEFATSFEQVADDQIVGSPITSVSTAHPEFRFDS